MRQLADWGANVIKIDALMEDAGDEQPGGPHHGSDFQNLHRNKRAMTLNLKDPKGLEVFRRLAEKADVVVENFRPDAKTKLGIDYESVRKINPRIVMAASRARVAPITSVPATFSRAARRGNDRRPRPHPATATDYDDGNSNVADRQKPAKPATLAWRSVTYPRVRAAT